MSQVQRVIKYCAMGFAVALMVAILTGITAIVSGIDKGVRWNGKTTYIDSITKEFENVESLDLTNYSGKMFIQVGSVNKVIVKAKKVPETTIIKMKDDNTLYIDDEAINVWFFDLHFGDSQEEDSQITIILPIDFVAKKAYLDNNSGDMEIRGLFTKELKLDGGSGNMIATNLKSSKIDISGGSGDIQLEKVQLSDGDIDGGSGSIQMFNCSMHNVDIDAGSGDILFEGIITGDNKLEGGSGSATLNISNAIDSFDFDFDAGSGDIYVNGEKAREGKTHNKDAENSLKIDGGSGEIAIKFVE